MEVDFNPGHRPVLGSNPPAGRRAPSAVTADHTMSFDQTTSLEQSLKDSAQIRPEKVAQASNLIADPSYPSDEVLNRMADLLARNINR